MNREEKSKNSKEKIIQSAFSLFSSKGYDSTSTQDIINLSGLSRGAMYHHFKTKEDILYAGAKAFVKANKGCYECGGYIYTGEGQDIGQFWAS